uniref:Secreted protein n=1 Tax=Plectus sambesii TaxID=2011161 RepID=A0A914W7B0_9BILA
MCGLIFVATLNDDRRKKRLRTIWKRHYTLRGALHGCLLHIRLVTGGGVEVEIGVTKKEREKVDGDCLEEETGRRIVVVVVVVVIVCAGPTTAQAINDRPPTDQHHPAPVFLTLFLGGYPASSLVGGVPGRRFVAHHLPRRPRRFIRLCRRLLKHALTSDCNV